MATIFRNIKNGSQRALASLVFVKEDAFLDFASNIPSKLV